MVSGQAELLQIVRSIRDRQETTDAKLDALTMEVHKIHGELTSIKKEQDRHNKISTSPALHSLEQETELRELKQAK